MSNVDAVNQNQNLLLTLLLESALKPQELPEKSAGTAPPAAEKPKADSQGDRVDLLI